MTQVHFTLKSEEIQSIIEYSVKDDVSKNILTTVFNQLMENQRTEYIQAKEYERTENRQSQRNGYYERSFTTRVGTLELKVPRTRISSACNSICFKKISICSFIIILRS